MLLPALALLAGCGDRQPGGATCGAVPDAWREPEAGIVESDLPPNKIWLGDREILWNGARVTPAQLHVYLAAAGNSQLPERVLLHIDPAADCATARAVVVDMARAPVCRDRDLCGTAERWPEQPPPPEE